MYVCMYVCMYACMYVCMLVLLIFLYMYIYIYACIESGVSSLNPKPTKFDDSSGGTPTKSFLWMLDQTCLDLIQNHVVVSKTSVPLKHRRCFPSAC